jgi:hypothetical protein
VKDWEIIADNLSKAGWSWGCVSALDSRGRTIWMQTHAATEKFHHAFADYLRDLPKKVPLV